MKVESGRRWWQQPTIAKTTTTPTFQELKPIHNSQTAQQFQKVNLEKEIVILFLTQ